MGKRSDFERAPRDFYSTPASAVQPLLQHLLPGSTYIEPCAGDGALVGHLAAAGHRCTFASDIEPQAPWIARCDALHVPVVSADFVITNPPWRRDMLHPLIQHYAPRAWTWLLADADWIHTRQSTPMMPFLHRIVSIGRVKWIEGSKGVGKDNCCWYLFGPARGQHAEFYGRC